MLLKLIVANRVDIFFLLWLPLYCKTSIAIIVLLCCAIFNYFHYGYHSMCVLYLINLTMVTTLLQDVYCHTSAIMSVLYFIINHTMVTTLLQNVYCHNFAIISVLLFISNINSISNHIETYFIFIRTTRFGLGFSYFIDHKFAKKIS